MLRSASLKIMSRPSPKSLPIGTQVVLLRSPNDEASESRSGAGAVGVVVGPGKSGDSFQVRLVDGSIISAPRESLAIRKHYQHDVAHGGRGETTAPDLTQFIIYRCVVGSRAFGLDEKDSDFDRRGIYLPPASLQWSLFGLPEQIESHETQECYWELEKFLLLALKANPNILECLYTPMVETASPIAEELLSIRSIFLSQLVYQTYNGYVMSQFKKLNRDLRNKGAIRGKHAMHLIRLLLSGIHILKEGAVALRLENYRDALLEVRRGEMRWAEVNRWRIRLHKEFDAAFASTRLPAYPDYERANRFLLEARLSMVSANR
jgi:uncharacterized protein